MKQRECASNNNHYTYTAYRAVDYVRRFSASSLCSSFRLHVSMCLVLDASTIIPLHVPKNHSFSCLSDGSYPILATYLATHAETNHAMVLHTFVLREGTTYSFVKLQVCRARSFLECCLTVIGGREGVRPRHSPTTSALSHFPRVRSWSSSCVTSTASCAYSGTPQNKSKDTEHVL